MNIEEAERLHKELWNWLADNPGADKHEWPGWVSNGGKVHGCLNACFACECTRPYEYYPIQTCTECPVNWPPEEHFGNEYHSCHCEDSLYGMWVDELETAEDEGRPPDKELLSSLARQIANLPWRK